MILTQEKVVKLFLENLLTSSLSHNNSWLRYHSVISTDGALLVFLIK